MKNFPFVVLLVLASLATLAQRNPDAQQKTNKIPTKEEIEVSGRIGNEFERRKFRYGVALNMYWSSIVGDNLPKEYFWKPSLGGFIRAQYNFRQWVGVSTGIGFQQGGAGIINQDISGGAFSHPWIVNKFGVRGDTDSTYLQKLRISNLEIPLAIEFRTTKGIIQPDWRLSGSLGVNYMRTLKVNEIWQSIVDGFHDDHYVTSRYAKTNFAVQSSLGFDIDSGSGQMFQCHFVYLRGLTNVYTNQGEGRQGYMGLRFTWLY